MLPSSTFNHLAVNIGYVTKAEIGNVFHQPSNQEIIPVTKQSSEHLRYTYMRDEVDILSPWFGF